MGATWPVDNLATDQIMAHFWKAYVETGCNAPAALRRAQLALRDHPYSHGDRDTLRAIGMPTIADRHTAERMNPSFASHAAPFWWAGFRIIGA
jgi:CHAT domain-containing protein